MDWKVDFRNKFYKECVDGGNPAQPPKINMAPHDLHKWVINYFESIVAELQAEKEKLKKQNNDFISVIMEQERQKDLLVNRVEGMKKDTDMWIKREKGLELEIAELQAEKEKLMSDYMAVQTELNGIK